MSRIRRGKLPYRRAPILPLSNPRCPAAPPLAKPGTDRWWREQRPPHNASGESQGPSQQGGSPLPWSRACDLTSHRRRIEAYPGRSAAAKSQGFQLTQGPAGHHPPSVGARRFHDCNFQGREHRTPTLEARGRSNAESFLKKGGSQLSAAHSQAHTQSEPTPSPPLLDKACHSHAMSSPRDLNARGFCGCIRAPASRTQHTER